MGLFWIPAHPLVDMLDGIGIVDQAAKAREEPIEPFLTPRDTYGAWVLSTLVVKVDPPIDRSSGTHPCGTTSRGWSSTADQEEEDLGYDIDSEACFNIVGAMEAGFSPTGKAIPSSGTSITAETSTLGHLRTALSEVLTREDFLKKSYEEAEAVGAKEVPSVVVGVKMLLVGTEEILAGTGGEAIGRPCWYRIGLIGTSVGQVNDDALRRLVVGGL
ncbi:hypothetical protein JCGZ_05123 [Jatropha curcas]|uniref:Uncharacterized protein n=1 Tax=Jatropha curcas TaxID=180498 RepID=A0A067KRQ2_JATCU|nr:hypothetical protein JCGZ_05123 [Jatropha curcas]